MKNMIEMMCGKGCSTINTLKELENELTDASIEISEILEKLTEKYGITIEVEQFTVSGNRDFQPKVRLGACIRQTITLE